MTVIVANDTPDAVRGMLKRWFIEPRANVFVGTMNRRVRDKTLEYIKRHAQGTGMLVIHSENNCQGFRIEVFGLTARRHVEMSGLWLVAEEWMEEDNKPF